MKAFFKRLPKLEVQFLGSGLLVAILSALLSLVYSHALGPQNRGVISVIFLTTLIFGAVALGGMNLSFRSHRGLVHPSSYTSAFLQVSIVSSFLASIFVMSSTLLYSLLKTPVASNLIFLAGIYSFLTTLQGQLFQTLLSLHLIRIRWKLDILVVSSQIAIYEILQIAHVFSIAVNIFLAFSFSYLVAILIVSKKLKAADLLKDITANQMTKVASLFRVSSSNYVYSILTALIDKIDRVIVLVFFSTEVFGKYSLLTGLLMFTRFIPDALGNLIVARRLEWIESHLQRNSKVRVTGLLLLGLIYAVFVQYLVLFLFGEKWRMPFAVAALFSMSELMRTLYATKMSFLFQNMKSRLPAKSAVMILILACIVPLSLQPFLSISAVPLGLFLAYVITFVVLDIFPKMDVIGDEVV